MSKTNNNILFSHRLLILFLLLEGASVMLVELAAARIISPYYGASLITWASVIGVTMSSLAIGYLVGGKMVDGSKNPQKMLLLVLFGTALSTVLMPYFGKIFMFLFLELPIELNTLLLATILLFPSLVLFGTVPQIIIKLLATQAENAGEITGFSYAVSTLGGVLGTLFIGFIIIPTFGITLPLLFTSLLLFSIPFWFLGVKNKQWFVLLYIPFSILIFKDYYLKFSLNNSANIKIQNYSEGLLGQLLVADYPYQDSNKNVRYNRMLMINRMAESTIDTQTNEVVFGEYIHILMKAIDPVPDNSNVLLLGLGGGNLIKQFQKRKFNIDVCELDQRIADAALTYFDVQQNFNLEIDDARHFLNRCKKKYDLIVFDVFKGENPPAYLLSKENITQLADLLTPSGIVVINFNGFLTGTIGKSGRSVIKTIINCNYKIKIFTSKAPEEERNSIFVFAKHTIDYAPFQNSKSYAELYTGKQISDIRDYEIAVTTIDLSDALILEDDRPLLDIINQKAAKNWRARYNLYYTNNFVNQGIPMFK